MANETPPAVVSDNDLREQAAQYTLAANPLVGVRLEDILDSARLLFEQMLSSPGVATREYLRFLTGVGRIATGSSELAPDAKDKRFADPTWKDSAVFQSRSTFQFSLEAYDVRCFSAPGGLRGSAFHP
jgi:polyhydroxyalkanoate synthase